MKTWLNGRKNPQEPAVGFRRRDRALFSLLLVGAILATWHVGTTGGHLHTERPWAAWTFYGVAVSIAVPVIIYCHRAIERFRGTGQGGGPPLHYALLGGVLVWAAGTLLPVPGPQIAWGIAAGFGLGSGARPSA
jgi:hypothetical protein